LIYINPRPPETEIIKFYPEFYSWKSDSKDGSFLAGEIKKLEKLSMLLSSDVIWDRVESVEEIPSHERYVYDISVNGIETFVVNNLIVHNSMLLKLVSGVVPRGKYVSGKGVTGVGLTASVRKDEVLGGWVLEAGALILCNKGLIAIDEFDKMNKDDQIAMHEATSVETVSIAKASIVATLPAQTAVLAGANPKLGRFDRFRPITQQLDIPETLMSRFDLKFALLDKPDRSQDEKLAEHIITSRISPEVVTPEIDLNLLRKYIAYAKKITDIELSKEAASILEKFYVDMRDLGSSGDVPTVSITLRQFEALLRIAEASAKVRLDNKLRVEDAERAIRLMRYSLIQLGMEPETGLIDIDRMESGVTATQRSRIRIMLDIIDMLQRELKDKDISVEDIMAEAQTQGVERAEDIMERLKREGMVFEPKPGFIRKL
jgi:replicative DNA helicase Mcm